MNNRDSGVNRRTVEVSDTVYRRVLRPYHSSLEISPLVGLMVVGTLSTLTRYVQLSLEINDTDINRRFRRTHTMYQELQFRRKDVWGRTGWGPQ